jgi:4-carboxymuconolactone decarboxylase
VTGPDRLPPIAAADMTPAQRAAAEALISGPRGKLAGPFVPLLRSPELMNRVQKLGEFLRFESALPARIKELAILVVSHHWDQGYEWSFHLPLALKAGVTRETAEAIAAGRRPSDMTPDESAAFELITQSLTTRQPDDQAYAAALHAFGEAGVIELIAFGGYYGLLAMVMNTARTAAPDAEIPLKSPLP